MMYNNNYISNNNKKKTTIDITIKGKQKIA